MGWEIHQIDVKTAFLNGMIEEEVYIEQPEGFKTHEKRTHVCKLKKALSGLKQAPRADDLFSTGSSKLIEDCKKNLEIEFDMKDLGLMHYFLELEVWQQDGARKWAPPYTDNSIGSLMYLVNTKPDLCYDVNTLNQFMVELKRAHWAEAKHILRHVCGTINFGLRYTKGNDIELSGFTDTDWAGSSVDTKSATGYYFVSKARCEAIWLRKLLVNLFKRRMEATRIFCDNQSCIKLSKNPIFHDHSKHIDIWCHFIRDYVQHGAIQLEYTPKGNQVADILTKAPGRAKFVQFRE
eukprot:PITA_02368